MKHLPTGIESWRTGRPAGGNLLCVSWLEGQFKAVAFRKGVVAGTWEAPGPVTDFAGLAAPLREAAARTQAEGRQVAFTLAHPRLSDQVLELPPARGFALERFLQRRVGEIKTFASEAVWSRQAALPLKGVNAALLHLFPTGLLNQLTRACQDADLQLVRVLPSTAVLGGQLPALPLAKDEVALLAAETGPDITLVVGRNDGRLCLGRMLGGGWSQTPEAVAVELTRTIGFAEQQAGVTVGGIWLFGADAAARAAALQPLLKRPVQASPVAATPFYWAEQAGQLPERDDGNLISPDAREAPQRRVRLTVTTASLIVLLAAALAIAGYVEKLRRNDLGMISQIASQISEQKRHQTDLERQVAAAREKSDVVRVISGERLPPVPATFLGYLGDAVPDDLVLTHCRIVRTNDFWSVRLEGSAVPAGNESAAAALARALTTLTNRLGTGPFHVAIARSQAGLAATPAPASPKTEAPTGANHFVIEGVIR
jgi:hypothetical protein